MLTKSGVAAVLVGIVCAAAGLGWHYEELVVIAAVTAAAIAGALWSSRVRQSTFGWNASRSSLRSSARGKSPTIRIRRSDFSS